jgi:hypothetical protein
MQEVMATQKDNIVLAKHLFEEYDDPAVVDKAKYILAKALDLQQKEDTPRKLASNPYACLSSVNKLDPKDKQSQTRSSEHQRREARNYKDPISLSSTPRDKVKGSMYKGAKKYRNPSLPPPRSSILPPRHHDQTEKAPPHGSGGIKSAATWNQGLQEMTVEASMPEEAIATMSETTNKVMMVGGTVARAEASRRTDTRGASTPSRSLRTALHLLLATKVPEVTEARDLRVDLRLP